VLGLLPGPALAAGSGTTSAAPTVNPLSSTNPLAPGLPQQTPTATSTSTSSAPVVASTTGSSSGGGLSGTTALIVAIGALTLIGGIAFYIWRDAHKNAPIKHRAAADGLDGGSRRAGSKPPPKVKAKARKLSPAERRRRKRGRAR
jgi:hypothetical protein